MINIKRFIDRVSMLESKQSNTFVIPINEARALRDELAKLLLDTYVENNEKKQVEPTIKIELKGGNFK